MRGFAPIGLLVGGFLLIGTPAVNGQTRRFDFRGHRFGEPKWAEAAAGNCSSRDDDLVKETCYLWDDTVGGVVVDISLEFLSGTFESVQIGYASDNYQTIAGALMEKYGKPTQVEQPTVQNAMGTRFVNEIVHWRLDVGDFTAQRYGSTLDKGYAGVSSARSVLHFTQQEVAKRKKAKSDL